MVRNHFFFHEHDFIKYTNELLKSYFEHQSFNHKQYTYTIGKKLSKVKVYNTWSNEYVLQNYWIQI